MEYFLHIFHHRDVCIHRKFVNLTILFLSFTRVDHSKVQLVETIFCHESFIILSGQFELNRSFTYFRGQKFCLMMSTSMKMIKSVVIIVFPIEFIDALMEFVRKHKILSFHVKKINCQRKKIQTV